ncbi:hypothetical protein YN1_8170 [Nanoarchaeota archaeon]
MRKIYKNNPEDILFEVYMEILKEYWDVVSSKRYIDVYVNVLGQLVQNTHIINNLDIFRVAQQVAEYYEKIIMKKEMDAYISKIVSILEAYKVKIPEKPKELENFEDYIRYIEKLLATLAKLMIDNGVLPKPINEKDPKKDI